MPEIKLDIVPNEYGLYEANVLLTLPVIAHTCMKADRSDLEYQLRNDLSEIVGEIVSKLIKDEF